MPYPFKDNQRDIYPKKFRYLMYIFAIIGFTFLPIHLILYHAIIIQDILDVIGGIILIGMARYGWGYKISRWWASRQLRKKDNRWKYGP